MDGMTDRWIDKKRYRERKNLCVRETERERERSCAGFQGFSVGLVKTQRIPACYV
jgi:hypothetical protein